MLARTNAGVFAIGIILVVLVTCAHSQQEIYMWVDDDGNVHYSDTQPEGVDSEQVHVNTSPPSDGYVPIPRAPSRQPLDEETDSELDAQQSERNHRLEREQRCLEGRKEIEILHDQKPVYRDEEGQLRVSWKEDTYHGEREYLDDEMFALEIERALKKIETHCEHPGDMDEQDDARNKWVRSERCLAAQSELEFYLQPELRSPPQTIVEKRQLVEKYCGD